MLSSECRSTAPFRPQGTGGQRELPPKIMLPASKIPDTGANAKHVLIHTRRHPPTAESVVEKNTQISLRRNTRILKEALKYSANKSAPPDAPPRRALFAPSKPPTRLDGRHDIRLFLRRLLPPLKRQCSGRNGLGPKMSVPTRTRVAPSSTACR